MSFCNKCNCDWSSEVKKNVEKNKIPFKCDICGGIYFPHKVLHSYIFFWADPIEPCQGKILIPEFIRQEFQSPKGTVLGIGKGYYKKKEFISTTLKPGDRIIYDKDIPPSWNVSFAALDGRKYETRFTTESDIKAKILEEGELELIGERILVKPDRSSVSSVGKIFIPVKHRKRIDRGKVVQLSGVENKEIKVGDGVLFNRNLVIEVDIKQEKYFIIRKKDVEAIL